MRASAGVIQSCAASDASLNDIRHYFLSIPSFSMSSYTEARVVSTSATHRRVVSIYRVYIPHREIFLFRGYNLSKYLKSEWLARGSFCTICWSADSRLFSSSNASSPLPASGAASTESNAFDLSWRNISSVVDAVCEHHERRAACAPIFSFLFNVRAQKIVI
eukprot:GEMP01059755.1.p1 GENE.GEMP01059755.1~~GEMP01059755.1.p1  ORF type:complete len:162 (+),score=0.93 GEMP01059755.1:861-1346(+)